MDTQAKINKYSGIIWDDQLPAEEEAFLHHLLNREQTGGFRFDMDSDYSLFLAYNAQQCGFQGYSDEQIRAFQLILRTYKIQNLNKIPTMSRVFRVLNENGITPLLMKGAAYLCYYAPGLPRMMGDIDIYIPPEQFDKALSLFYEIGFSFSGDTGYHVEVTSEHLDMDVHRTIYKNGGETGSDIHDRFITCTYLGSRVYVLSPKDMLLHQLVNRGQDICVLAHMKRHLKWIIDCYTLLLLYSPDADELLKEAKALNNLFFTELTLSKLVSLFPERFSNRGTRIKDEDYCSFLKCVANNIKNEEKRAHNGKTADILRVGMQKWETAKIYKIVTESDRSVLQVMLGNKKVRTLDGFVRRAKRVIESSRGEADK